MAENEGHRKMTFFALRDEKQKSSVPGGDPPSRINFLFEHVTLISMTALAGLGAVLWVAAVATDYWVILVSSSVQQIFDNANGLPRSDIFLWSYSGLWQRCDIFYKYSLEKTPPLDNVTVLDTDNHITKCSFHPLSIPIYNNTSDSNEDSSHPSKYVRAGLSVVVLVVVIMTLTIGFSAFALRHPRYMYKRVAAALHALTVVTIFVVIELVGSSGHPGHGKSIHDGAFNQEGETIREYHGYSYLLAWTVLLVFASTGASFLCMSGKRKNLLQDSDVVLK